jgi:hypothetical protein
MQRGGGSKIGVGKEAKICAKLTAPNSKQKTSKLGYSYSKLVKSTFSTDIITNKWLH